MTSIKNETANKRISGKATSEQIEAWKKEHGSIYEIIVDDKACYLKKFSRQALSHGLELLRGDVLDFGEAMAENNWIDGDKDIYKDPEYLVPLSNKLAAIINDKKADWVKY